MKTVATGGNPPKPKDVKTPGAKPPAPRVPLPYTFHPDGTFSMKIGRVLDFIDAEGRTKLTKARDEACDLAESLLSTLEAIAGAPYDELREKLAKMRAVGERT